MYLNSALAYFNVRENRSLCSQQPASCGSKDALWKFSRDYHAAKESIIHNVRAARGAPFTRLICPPDILFIYKLRKCHTGLSLEEEKAEQLYSLMCVGELGNSCTVSNQQQTLKEVM